MRDDLQPTRRHAPLRRLTAILLALTTLGVAAVEPAGADDALDAFFADPPALLLDHRTGTGVRVSDAAGSAPRSPGDAARFHTKGPAGSRGRSPAP